MVLFGLVKPDGKEAVFKRGGGCAWLSRVGLGEGVSKYGRRAVKFVVACNYLASLPLESLLPLFFSMVRFR